MKTLHTVLTVLCLCAALASPALAQDIAPDADGAPIERAELDSLVAWRDLMTRDTTELDALLETHVGSHPSVALPAARAEVARARAEVVDTLPDPTLRASVMGIPWTRWTLDETPMSGIQLDLGWMFPWPGSLSARAEVARAEAVAIERTTGEQVLAVELEATRLYWSIYRVDRTLESLDEIESVLADMQRLAEARYRFGSTREADILQVGLERTRVDERRLALLASRAELTARFNALLGRADDAAIVPPAAPAPGAVPGDLAETLTARAMASRPVFEALDAREALVETRLEAADYGDLPALMVGASYRLRFDSGMDPVDGEDFLGFMVGVTLPIASAARVDDELTMLARERDAIEVERAVTERQLEVEIAGSVARLAELEQQIAFTRDTLRPEAQATLETLVAVYPTEGADFLDLLQAERRILEIDLTLHDQLAEHHRLRDQLERLASSPVTTQVADPIP